jgi:Protein of unknown function (DUF2950)
VVLEDLAVPVAWVVLVVSADLAVPVAWVALAVPGDLAVQVALLVSESPGVLAVPVARVALDQQHVPEAERAPGRRRVRAAATAGRIASEIAVFPAEPRAVARLAAVDAAAVQRGQQAAAAATVWVAAGTAAAVGVTAEAAAAVITVAAEAVGAAVVVVVAAAEGEDRRKAQTMISTVNIMNESKILLIASAILIGSFLAPVGRAADPKPDASAAAGQAKGKEFASAKEAADALVQAAASFDQAALKEILGPDSDEIVSSEDPVQDKNRAAAFAEKAKEKSSIDIDKKKADHAILVVGKEDFPLPIPIVKQKGKWFFDTKVGKEEVLNRRIGANELDAIAICRGFVEAQHEYSEEKHDDAKINQYAQKIISTPGKHDGLAWQNADGTWGGPVGQDVAKALEQGYTERGQPYHGYYFKVLKKQGPAAPGGEIDFVVGGAMIGGFALVAAPAEYRVTGVKTFMVGPDGVVYEKDLGPDTLKTFQAMDTNNPDKTWKLTEDEWPEEEESGAANQ